MSPAVVAVLVVLALASQLAAAESACRCDGHRGLVCGSDGNTYRSRCHLGCKSVASLAEGRPPLWMAHEGACRTGAVGGWKKDFNNCRRPCLLQTLSCFRRCRDDACATKCIRQQVSCSCACRRFLKGTAAPWASAAPLLLGPATFQSMHIDGSNVLDCLIASNRGIAKCQKQCHNDGCLKKCVASKMEKLCSC